MLSSLEFFEKAHAEDLICFIDHKSNCENMRKAWRLPWRLTGAQGRAVVQCGRSIVEDGVVCPTVTVGYGQAHGKSLKGVRKNKNTSLR